jgi:pimeloyl-ACP methyl ester carboxylesterase
MANRTLAILAVITTLGIIVGCSPTRLVESSHVLADIAAGSGDSSLKESTATPIRRTLTFTVDGRDHVGDLYTPVEGALAGMVLVPGVAPAGKDDRRLVDFATTLARARFEVLVPDLPRMRALRVTPLDALDIADAAIYLDERGGGRPLGMTAISFAVGPMVVALLEPGMEGRVDFMITVGGYYDLEAVITFFTTGNYRSDPERPWRYREPNVYGKWVFVLSNANRLDDPGDQAALIAMAGRKRRDPNADISDLTDSLGPQGQSVHALLVNKDPNKVPALLAALPAAVTEEIRALDLRRRDLSALDTDFILVHGRDDPIIPETESLALAESLPPGRAKLYLLDTFQHVEAAEIGFADKLTLLSAVYTVLKYRDGRGLAE